MNDPNSDTISPTETLREYINQNGVKPGPRRLEQFKQALTTIFTALSGLAQQRYLSDMFTVGLIRPNGNEIEIYAPEVLEPGMYGLDEAQEE